MSPCSSGSVSHRGGRATAWCLLVHTEASVSLSRSHHAPVPRRTLNVVFALAVDAAAAVLDAVAPDVQGLTLDHFSAQRKRFLLDEGYIQGLFRGYLGGVQEY
jgi:hypothetical protein